MAKKVTEREENIEVNAVRKKETFVTKWFRDYAVNDADALKTICDLTSRSAEEQFGLRVSSSNTEVYAVTFYATFITILEFIRSKEKLYNNFTIEISNSINIGYTNNSDDRNEKVGNFMPIMEFIGVNRNLVDNGSATDPNRTTSNYISWKNLNVKKNEEYMKEIQERAYARLKAEYRTDLRTSEAIIPLFCIFMDHISHVLKMKFREAQGTDVSEVSMNVLGLFDAYYSFNEETNEEIIDFQPNIMMKLSLKCDDIASRDS